MATEAQVSTAIIRGFKLCGHHVFKCSDKFTAGVSDILGTFSALPRLSSEAIIRDNYGRYGGRTIAVETKLTKSLPSRESSKVLQHELSVQQFRFLESVASRGGLAYVALAFPRRPAGVDVALIDFDAWEAGSEAFGGQNISLGWLTSQRGRRAHLMRGNLTTGFLASAGPLEAAFR